jgi:long-subunit acyl-CoA synthetase (AMP-forming)/alkylation response protein AidB-like acyl-CoA dehydrogenase
MSVAPLSSRRDADAPPAAAASLVDLLHARALDAFDRPALVLDGSPASNASAGSSLTWGALIAAALDYARVLESCGLAPGDRLAHVGPHSPQWIIVDFACLLSGIVHVALHADESPAEIDEQMTWLAPHGFVENQSGEARGSANARGAWAASAPRRDFCRPRAGATESVKHHVVPPPRISTATLTLDRAAILESLAARATTCDPDAPAAIFLSSGTTGRPRAVIHSQRALAWNAAASSGVFLDDPRDVRLSWLPLSHAYARVGDLYTALVRGSTLCLVADRRLVLDACRRAAPTVILGVPAFFERLAAGVAAGRIPDLATALGGQVRVCVSGGAPLKDRTAAVFAAQGVPLVQGYGLAEAGPVVALANPRTVQPGTVGPPLPGVEVRLDAHGQVVVRSPSTALAVIDPDQTSPRPATHDGWLDTGDTGAFDEAGHLRITGRVVDTLVLSTGAKVPPAEVERALAEDPAVAQVCVLGAGLAAPVALIVPEPDAVRAAVRQLGLRVFSRRQALAHPRLLRWLARRLAKRQAHLPKAWRVRRAAFVGRPFDAAHGEATAGFKLKRSVIAEHFASVLAAAAEPVPPAWMADIPSGRRPDAATEHAPPGPHPLASALWQAANGGFAAAATASATPLRDSIAAILEQADRAVEALRADGLLYEPLPAPAPPAPPAPLADAPAAPFGRFTAIAEAALGDVGLWGLAVPEAFGGAGASMLDLARAVTHVAARVPTAAGLLSVHSSIGAVSALAAFGSPDQQARHLPGLAQGQPLSIFGATEPDAGCDLAAISTVIERTASGLAVSGTKMFITGATYGRLVKLLALRDGRPAVVLVRLPDSDTPSFRLRHYALHPLKHAHNAALEFNRFPIAEADVLAAPAGRDGHDKPDAMRIIWHGLNRGRVTLAAQAAGTLRILLAQARDHALARSTWGAPIASRELVQGRLGRIAARIVACDSLAGWAATAIDAGGSGELEALVAKIVAGECVRDSAIDALGVHGGRAFLVGHPLGDSFHDHFAVTVYEGESDLLGLALFKGLAKRHPCAATSRSATARAAAWLAWRAGAFARPDHDGLILDRMLRDHARRARRGLARVALAIDRTIRRHGRSLAEKQLEIGALSSQGRDLVSVIAVAHHADADSSDHTLAAADVWCRLALARASGRHLTPADHTAVAALGKGSLG